jgi:vitamin B12 transporter
VGGAGADQVKPLQLPYNQIFPFIKKCYEIKFGLYYKQVYVCDEIDKIVMRKSFFRPFLLLGFFGFSTVISAQTIVSGKVSDKKNPLAGASITLKDTYDGATSDSSGKFSFKTFEKGEFIISATSIGYKTFEQKIKLEGKGSLAIDIILKEEVTELSAVVLTAGTFEASDRKRASTVLNPIDIVTTASANGDITGALKTLPGAQQIGESEGLFVRGGTAAETKIFIDGSLVNNFFYSSVPNVAQFSRFSPFLFKGTVFSTGGYSALYGQALSSALILESIDFPNQSSANLGISMLSANGGYQHLSKNKKFSAGATYSYTNLGLAFAVIKQRQDYSQVPEFHGADFNFRIKTSNTGVLKYYGYFNSNRLAFTVNSIDSLGYFDKFSLKNKNFYHNLAWKESLGKKWKIYFASSYSTNRDDIKGRMQNSAKEDVLLTGLEFKNFGLDIEGNYMNAKMVFERRLKGLSAIRLGSEYNYSNDYAEYILHNGQKFPGRLKENITSAFAEGDIYLTNAVAAKLGTRLEHSSLLDKTSFAPRLSLAYKLNKTSQASMAYGIFYQNPEKRYLPSPNPISFMKATHYILQYQKTTKLISFRTEVFYKKYNNLIKTGVVNGQEVALNNRGSGDAKGIEFFYRDKKTFKNLDYWISYSYLDTKRDFLNFPEKTAPNFAARHTASLVLKKFVLPWKTQFNGSYNYASGRPHYHIGFDGTDYYFTDKGKIPDYHNVSFAINYLPFIGKQNAKTFAVYVLQVSNIFNIKQIYGYQYSYNGMRRETIVPPSRIFVFIGAFFSFGIDRSEDIINSRLL